MLAVWLRMLPLALVAFVLAACHRTQPPAGEPGEGSESTAQDAPQLTNILAPPGMILPIRVEPACPGEGCTYGAWLACDTVPLYAAPGDISSTGQSLMPGSTFDVASGAVIVEVPTVVIVTRPTEQMRFLTGGVTFATGDTLYILDYLGEGFVNAWYRDSMLEVEIFWPWDNFYPAPGFQYGGEVAQEGSTSFWVRTDRSPEEWVLVDAANVAAPNSLDPDPPACTPTG